MKKSWFGKVVGGGYGAFIGKCIGGIGIAVGGTAFGVPAICVTVACGVIGSTTGNKIESWFS